MVARSHVVQLWQQIFSKAFFFRYATMVMMRGTTMMMVMVMVMAMAMEMMMIVGWCSANGQRPTPR